MQIKAIIFFVILIIIGLAFKLFVDKLFKRKYSYYKKEYLMTQSERDCFNALMKACDEAYIIFPQVHFSAFLDNKVTGQNWNAAFWHINGKSVDFLLCTKEQLSPVLAIELDDRSHEREDRQLRDKEEERIFSEATMPLLRLEHSDISNIEELSRKIQEALSPMTNTAAPQHIPWFKKLFARFV